MAETDAPAAHRGAPSLLWLREFPGEPRAVPESRHWIAGILPACDPREILLQVASELAANAVEHTRSGRPGGTFGVHVAWSARTVRVTVADQGSPAAPSVVAATVDHERMRGLHIVEVMTAAWGTAGGERGRWVWADVPWSGQGGPARIDPGGALPAAEAIRRLHLGYPLNLAGHLGQRVHAWPGALAFPDKSG